ncbi:MAG: hypothetical protein Q8Q33_01705 [Chlamydiota bacterium]|nr:hypothetical protein [Chlamydiota bacterium]
MDYQKPVVLHFSCVYKPIFAQYIFNASQCPNYGEGHETLKVKSSWSDCFTQLNPPPPEGLQLNLQCLETGSNTYIQTFENIIAVESNDCPEDGTMYQITLSIKPAPPGYCTITSAIVNIPGSGSCDLCIDQCFK